jgi:transcriptional/translational regulatory protein YebC/TACO1
LNADINVDDVESKDGQVTVFAPASEFYKAKTALLEAFPKIDLEVQEITFHPQANKELSADDVPMFEKFINLLNDCDDVQEIYHNAVLPG